MCECHYFRLTSLLDTTTTTAISPLSLHDALPIWRGRVARRRRQRANSADDSAPSLRGGGPRETMRSEEHTSELQSRFDVVCRLLLEKKNPVFLRASESEITSDELGKPLR